MAVEQISLELIDDNPFNPRKHYPRDKVKEMAYSLKEVGLRQIPEARPVNGRYQLAYGHMRKLAWAQNYKKDPKAWAKMPLDVKEISDEQMFHFAIEENLRRTDIRPIEVARCFENYFAMFPEATETELAKKHNMTQGNVSNMRRVLKLPELILEKIDAGTINFTMGRELLVIADLPNAKDLMSQVIAGLQFGNKATGYPCTVEGIQKSIDYVCSNHLKPIRGGRSWGARPDFDIKECEKCERLLITHPDKTSTSAYCKDEKCWDKKQEAHRKAASEAAIKKMQEDLARKVVAETTISQEIPPQKKVAGAKIALKKKATPVVIEETGVALHVPCDSCALADSCDRTYFHVATDSSGELVCERKVRAAPEEVKVPAMEVPEDILARVRETAGTRAEVLDLKDIGAGYQQEVGQGYALLDGFDRSLEHILDPGECLERCTHGFHFAFDSRQREPRTRYVCSDTKCLAKKKAAFTRAKNAEGQALKKAEVRAVKQAVVNTFSITREHLKVILLAQIEGSHVQRYYNNEQIKRPSTWLWDKVSAGIKDLDRTDEKLFKAIDKLTDEDLSSLVMDMMFYYLMDHGDVGTYEIKTEVPLGWLGVKIELPQETAGMEEGS